MSNVKEVTGYDFSNENIHPAIQSIEDIICDGNSDEDYWSELAECVFNNSNEKNKFTD